MVDRAKLILEMLEIGQALGLTGGELHKYMEQQVKAAEVEARDEREARRSMEKEEQARLLEIDKRRIQLQVNAEEAKATAKAKVERETAEAKAAIE